MIADDPRNAGETPQTVRVLDQPPEAVVLVGAGGTGGVLLGQLCRLLYGIQELSERDRNAPRLPDFEREDEFGDFEPYDMLDYGAPPLIIIDGDVVEPSNIRRQMFIEEDLHKKKALALAGRYSAAFGLDVESYPRYLSNEIPDHELRDIIPESSVVVGAVDNAATRKLLHEHLDAYENVVYLDSGNAGVPAPEQGRATELTPDDTGYDGQVVCGARRGREKVLPFPADVFPDLIEVEDPEDRLPTDIPCGEVIVSNPQRLVTNVQAAATLLSYLTPILMEGAVPNALTFFDARRGYLRSRKAARGEV